MTAPDRGDLVWLSFHPQAGSEQSGRRPALVLSPASYNRAAGLMLACPITKQAKGYPFEVAIANESPVTGVVLVDHIKSVDWRARECTAITKAPGSVVEKVSDLLRLLLQLGVQTTR